MRALEEYRNTVGTDHLRKYGQFFTPTPIANFMADWILAADTRGPLLDPALGNGIFPIIIGAKCPNREIVGYEIDPKVVQYFRVPPNVELHLENFLTAGWKDRYAGIIGNPPYMKFQLIKDRKAIRESLSDNSRYPPGKLSNLYLLFTVKAAQQLKDGGRLAFLIPPDFLDSKTGEVLKELLLTERLLEAIIQIDDSKVTLFEEALTSSCILLLSKKNNCTAKFAIIDEPGDLPNYDAIDFLEIQYTDLKPDQKWGPLFHTPFREEAGNGHLGKIVKIKRGIATGANAFFLLSKSKADAWDISSDDCRSVIAKAADAKSCIFTAQDFERISDSDKNTMLFDPTMPLSTSASAYINFGIQAGYSSKYICAHRPIWFKGERQEPAPIWISQGSRGRVKVVRNLAGINHLTAFHGLYPYPEYKENTDGIFALLLSSRGQALMKRSAKRMASGMLKFQPRDLTDARFFALSPTDPKWKIANIIGKQITEDGMLTADIEAELNSFTKNL